MKRYLIATVMSFWLLPFSALADQQHNLYDAQGNFFDVFYYAEDVPGYALWLMDQKKIAVYFEHTALRQPGTTVRGFWVSENPQVPDCAFTANDHLNRSYTKWGYLEVKFNANLTGVWMTVGNCNEPLDQFYTGS